MRFDCLYKLWHIEETTFLITSILSSSNIGEEYVFAHGEGAKICKWHVCTYMCGQMSRTRIKIRFNNQRMIQIIKANIVKSDKCSPFVL